MSQVLIQQYLNQLQDLHKALGCRMSFEKSRKASMPYDTRDYRLGNRSALEWILDQYKKRNPKTQPSAKSSTPIASRTTKKK